MAIRRASKSSISAPTTRVKGSSLIAGYGPGIDEMDLIQRVTVGSGGAASIDFTSIPQTYQHLHCRGIARDNNATGIVNNASLRINSISTNSYAAHDLYGTGAVASSYGSASRSNVNVMPWVMSAATLSNNFAVFIIDILDYASTSKTKVLRQTYGGDNNGSGQVGISSGLFDSTDAVSTLTLFPASTLFSQYTTVSLYGVIA